MQKFSSLHKDDQYTIKWRAGIGDCISNEICYYHIYKFDEYFKLQYTKCCNLFQKHHRRKVKGGQVITLKMAEKLREKYFSVVPGWRFCRTCYQVANSPEEKSTTQEEEYPDSDYELSEIELEVRKQT